MKPKKPKDRRGGSKRTTKQKRDFFRSCFGNEKMDGKAKKPIGNDHDRARV